MKKTTLQWMLAFFVCAALVAGCDDDEKSESGIQPPSQTEAAFQKQFPGATNVSWSKKSGYDVAAFSLATRAAAARNTAWYPEGGTAWVYTTFEISYMQLQQEAPAVVTAWESSPYKTQGYRIDEIDKRTYADSDPTYKLEIESASQERELIYKTDGTLLSDFLDPDTDDDDEEDEPCPEPILRFLTANLPDALIVECDTERHAGVTTYGVEVIYRQEESDLYFDEKYTFIHAVAEIDEDDLDNPGVLPAAVYAKIAELARQHDIDDVSKVYRTIGDFKAGTNAFYAVMVEERNGRESLYVFDAEGNRIE